MRNGTDDVRDGQVPVLDTLKEVEKAWWTDEIRDFRARIVQPPSHYVRNAFAEMGLTADRLDANMDSAIIQIRELSYSKYLQDEAKFHAEVFKRLTETREIPSAIMSAIVKPLVGDKGFPQLSERDLVAKLSDVAGEFVGRIFPYVYQLCLSTTQSRRTRAGKEFEIVIEQIMAVYNYLFEAQSTIGAARFQELDLAKAVDFLVPSTDAYESNRPKCAVITAKTTLRERWQQVAEELQRTSVPAIYLLTLDDGLSEAVVQRLIRYNITLVLLESEKEAKFSNIDQVLSFKSFFSHDLPHVLSYWKDEN
ncbi:MAG: type II restriction endonuclease [Armatimonadota bacterium]|jgi:hypothetical protein